MQRGALYHHESADVYECLGCSELLEVPYRAVLKNGQASVSVKTNPENRMLWVELMELDHAACGQFKDARMAEEARLYRQRTVRPRGDDGPRSNRHQAPLST